MIGLVGFRAKCVSISKDWLIKGELSPMKMSKDPPKLSPGSETQVDRKSCSPSWSVFEIPRFAICHVHVVGL